MLTTKSRLTVISVVVAAIALGALAVGLLDPFAGQATDSRYVVLASADEAAAMGISPEDGRFQRVESSAELEAAKSDVTKAVILTESSVDLASRAWIKAQMDGGLVVAAIGWTPKELSERFAVLKSEILDNGVVAEFDVDGAKDYGDQLFFTVIYDFANEDMGRTKGATTWEYESTDQFLRHVERYINNVEMRSR